MSEDFWIEFLLLYKEQTCLWDKSCNEYQSVTMRDLAYSVLLEKMWEVDANATIESVMNKIKNFHRSYKVYKKRETESKRSNYMVKPWIYAPYLDFYYKQDNSDTATGTCHPSAEFNLKKNHPTISINAVREMVADKNQQQDKSDHIIILDDCTEDKELMSTNICPTVPDAEVQRTTEEEGESILPDWESDTNSIQFSTDKDQIQNCNIIVQEVKSSSIKEDHATLDQAAEAQSVSEDEEAVNSILYGVLNHTERPVPFGIHVEEETKYKLLIDEENLDEMEFEEEGIANVDKEGPPPKKLRHKLATIDPGVPGTSRASSISKDSNIPHDDERAPARNVPIQDHECIKFSAYLAAKMRAFDPEQKCIAQKLIGDVIFFASTKQLRLSSRIDLGQK